jgi:hypothetical protein
LHAHCKVRQSSIFVRSPFNSKHAVYLHLCILYCVLLTNATLKEPIEKKMTLRWITAAVILKVIVRIICG